MLRLGQIIPRRRIPALALNRRGWLNDAASESLSRYGAVPLVAWQCSWPRGMPRGAMVVLSKFAAVLHPQNTRIRSLAAAVLHGTIPFPHRRKMAAGSGGMRASGFRTSSYRYWRRACMPSETQVSFGVHPCRVLQYGHRENVTLLGSLSMSARSISTLVWTSFFVLGHSNINFVNGTSQQRVRPVGSASDDPPRQSGGKSGGKMPMTASWLSAAWRAAMPQLGTRLGCRTARRM
jgi:hypothetical protein